MGRLFAITSFICLVAAAVSYAQNVDVVSQVAQARLIANAPLSQVIDNVVTSGEFAFFTSGTPLAVFAVNVTQMRSRTPAASVRNVTIAQDSSPSGVAIGTSVFFFGFQTIYRLNASQVVANPNATFNATANVSSFKYERLAGQNPIPTRAFSAVVAGNRFAFFVGSSPNEVTNRREIIRVDPARFNEGVENATKVISISLLDGLQDATFGTDNAVLLFSRSDSNQTVIAIFNPTSETVTKTVVINDLSVAGRTISFDEPRQAIYVAGQRYSDVRLALFFCFFPCAQPLLLFWRQSLCLSSLFARTTLTPTFYRLINPTFLKSI